MRRFPWYALLACLPVMAWAGDEAGHFYIGPEVGGITASGARGTKEHDWCMGSTSATTSAPPGLWI
jgi:hypothetical protein